MFLVGPGGLAGEWHRQPVSATVGSGTVVGAGTVGPPSGFGLGLGGGYAAELGSVGAAPPTNLNLNTAAEKAGHLLSQPPIEVTAPSPDNGHDRPDELIHSIIQSCDRSNQLNQLDTAPDTQAAEQTVALIHREAEVTA